MAVFQRQPILTQAILLQAILQVPISQMSSIRTLWLVETTKKSRCKVRSSLSSHGMTTLLKTIAIGHHLIDERVLLCRTTILSRGYQITSMAAGLSQVRANSISHTTSLKDVGTIITMQAKETWWITKEAFIRQNRRRIWRNCLSEVLMAYSIRKSCKTWMIS